MLSIFKSQISVKIVILVKFIELVLFFISIFQSNYFLTIKLFIYFLDELINEYLEYFSMFSNHYLLKSYFFILNFEYLICS